MRTLNSPRPLANSLNPELDALLHPTRAFAHPQDILADPDLTLNEKRAILASWASDACAVEAAPAWRRAPGSERPVSVDAILEDSTRHRLTPVGHRGSGANAAAIDRGISMAPA